MGNKQGKTMEIKSVDSLLVSPEQQRYIVGSPKTQLDKAHDDFRFSEAIKNSLGRKVAVSNAKGEAAMISVADLLVSKRIAFLMEHPDRIDLTEISKALGEQKTDRVDVNVNVQPSSIFGKLDEYQNKNVIDAVSTEPKKAGNA